MKSLSVMLLIVLSIVFSGCGGGGGGGGSTSSSGSSGSDGGTSSETTSGFTVVDPYIENATFFWDKDKDGVKDTGEPESNPSDENGSFTFDSSIDIPEGAKLVMLDKGEHNGISYTGQLEAVISSTKVISPLTTLKSKYEDSNITGILEAAGVSIDEDDIDADPMKSGKHQHIVASISTDLFLKLYSFSNINPSEIDLKDIVELVQLLILQDISKSNIENTVSIIDYLTDKIKKDGNFDELTKLLTDNEYRNAAKAKLENRTDKNKPGLLKKIKDDWESKEPNKDSSLLDDIIGSYTASPRKNESTTYSLEIDSFPSGSIVEWGVSIEPSGSSLSLSVSSDKKSITFTPSVVGAYELYVTVNNTTSGMSEKLLSFNVKEVFDIEMDKVEGITDDTNLSEHVGIVTNQTWIASSSLGEDELTALVNEKKTLSKLGYDKSSGLLVEYDENDSTTLEDIEELKYEPGIDSVYNNVYVGEDAIKPMVVHPNDNGAFNDGGDNWHLEVINMPEAWEYTKGTDNFFIGIIDAGFDNLHSDMQGRFATFLTNDKHNHGMGVAGAIVANSNNGMGISGINWVTDAVASGLHYTSDIENVVDTTINGKETKLVTNSWGLEYIPSNFNPTNASMANTRFERMQSILAWIRQIVSARTDKLFLWAAGNGVGNGGSNSGYYGVDSKYDNGAMAYQNGSLSKLDNLLLVSAFVKQDGENVLVYYSNHGQSVDIAAPTHFKSMQLNNGYYNTSGFNSSPADTTPISSSGFGGTSAATPVAAAVTSLIYSINPDFTPAQVKNILVSSASEYITKRQKYPYGPLEDLAHPIPMLDAEAAVKMAHEMVYGSGDDNDGNDGDNNQNVGVDFVVEISDHFTPKADIRYFSYNKEYKVTAISSTVKSSETNSSYTNYSSNTSSSDSDIVKVTLDNSKNYHQITSTLTLQHIFTGETITVNSIKPFTYSDLIIKTVNFSTGASVPSADFNGTYKTITDNYSFAGITNSVGEAKAYVPYGYFKFVGSKTGFRDAKQTISAKDPVSYTVVLPFGQNNIGEAGAISGTVLDEKGDPISGATVTIYDDTKTIKSAITDSNGDYELWNISKYDNDNKLITNFKLTADASGYGTVMKQKVIVLDAINRIENFTLIKEPDNHHPLASALITNIDGNEVDTLVVGSIAIISAHGTEDEETSTHRLDFKWVDDFDGSTLSTKYSFIKSNLAIGVHNITLTVTDEAGAIANDTVTITITGEPTYSWVTSDWGECEGACETTGTQSRTVTCKSSTGDTVSDSYCSGEKPLTSQSCMTADCPFEYNEITSPVTGRIWIDRNLGAKEACTMARSEFDSDEEYVASQEDCLGDLYQWGREKDGHQKTDSNITSLVSNSIDVSHSKFIMTDVSHDFDWTSVDESGSLRESRWANIKGNSVCPNNFRVPTLEEIEAENITSRAIAHTNLKLPAGGFRFIDQGDFGAIWINTSKLVDERYNNYYLKYSKDDFAFGLANRIAGMPVRCIKVKEEELNEAPVAEAGNNQFATFGDSVTLDGSGSSDSDGSIVSYEWKLGSTVLSSSVSFSSTNFTEGVHQVVLTVRDDDGATDTDTVLVQISAAEDDVTYDWATSTWSSCAGECGPNNAIQTRTVVCKSSKGNTVSDTLCEGSKPSNSQSCTASECEVENKPPVANAGSNKQAYFGENVTLDGTGSYDLDGSIVSFEWKLGTASLASSDTFSINTLSVGTHAITLKVVDNEAAEDTDIVLVEILSEPTYGWQMGSWSSCTGECGENVGTKTRSAVCKNSLGTTVNDSYCQSSTKPTDETQNCTASLCEDDNVPPIANAGSNITITYGDVAYLNGSSSSDSDGYIVSYSWSMNSSVISNSKTYSKTDLTVGSYTAILTVTDNDGASDSDQVTITVEAIEDNTYNWHIGPWSDCAGDCGKDNGLQTRTIVCKSSTNATVADSQCSNKPTVTQSCTASECPVEDNETIVSPVTGRIWMDRNLGASRECTSMYDTECFGDYYQWGRDDDGHEMISSLNSNQIITSLEDTNSDFVVSSELYDYDWINVDNDGAIRSAKWSTSDATSICPDGFRLPTQSELIAENIGSASDAYNNLKLPLSGDRAYIDGNIYGQTFYGGIWSSNADGKNSMFLFYSPDYVEWLYHSRATGRSVRCIQDQ